MKAAKILRLPRPAPLARPPAQDSVPDAARIVTRGWAPVWYPGETNRCPSCGERDWKVGRVTAECAHCDMPLLIRVDGSEQP